MSSLSNIYLHKPRSEDSPSTLPAVDRGIQIAEYLRLVGNDYDWLVTEKACKPTMERVYFGMDQATSAPVDEVLENMVSWYQHYESHLYGENNE